MQTARRCFRCFLVALWPHCCVQVSVPSVNTKHLLRGITFTSWLDLVLQCACCICKLYVYIHMVTLMLRSNDIRVCAGRCCITVWSQIHDNDSICAGLAAVEVAESWGSHNALVNAGVFLTGVCRPVGTTLLLGLSTIMQQRLRRQG